MPLLPADYRKTTWTHRQGTAAARPDADTVLEGTLYWNTDTFVLHRSDGTSWDTFSIDPSSLPSPTTISGTSDAILQFNYVLSTGCNITYAGDDLTITNLDGINGSIILELDTKEVVVIEPDDVTIDANLAVLAPTDIAGALTLSAGTGTIRQVNTEADTAALYLIGGTAFANGSSLQFYGESHGSFPGHVYMVSGGANASPASIIELAYRDSGGYKGRWTMNSAGKFGIASGYSNGGTVTQASNKSTGVTLSKVTGEITTHNATLNADTTVSFLLTNTLIAAGDYVMVQHVSGGTVGSYTVCAVAAAGSATITLRNITAGNLGEAIVIKFFVFKAVNS